MLNARNLTLSNADGLDEILYNQDGGSSVSPEMIQAGVTATAGIATAIANRPKSATQQELKAMCGRKPLLLKKKKEAYQKCVDNYLRSKSASSQPTTTQTYTPPASSYKTSKPEGKKFLGMPMGVGITVAVLATAAIGFGVYKLVLKK
jgi:hypothetical protein